MEFKDLIKDYSKTAHNIDILSPEKKERLLECFEMDSFPVIIDPLEDKDFIPGVKIYVKEFNPSLLSPDPWCIYNITYVRSGVVFYKKENSTKEDYFPIDSIFRKWMFPTKVNIGKVSDKRIHIKCTCPLVQEIRD